MSEASNNYGAPGIAERLSVLRSPQTAPTSGVSKTPNRGKAELLIGVIVVLASILLAFLFRGGNKSPAITADSVLSESTVVDSRLNLMSGEALVAVAINPGNFPPSLAPGDTVRVVVTPGSDGSGTVRSLKEITVVQSVTAPTDMNNQFVITMRSEESIATAIAASGPVHLAIVKGKEL